jgi:uncharacterized phage infection (PIP) family protein YhgE
MFKRLVGLLILLIGLAGVTISVGGIIYVQTIPEDPPGLVEDQLGLLQDSLVTLSGTITTTSQGLTTISDSLASLQDTTLQWTDAVSNTLPAIESADTLITQQLPDALRTVQETLPALEQTASIVDQTLIQVSQLQSLLRTLGLISSAPIYYNPDLLLGDGIAQLDGTLEGLPEQLESFGPSLDLVKQQLGVVNDTIVQINDINVAVTQDVQRLNENVDELNGIIARLEDVPGEVRTDFRDLVRMLKPVLTGLLVWLGLSQLVPLYFGFQVLRGQAQSVNPADQR